ncbi:PREDICTED: CASP-like protein 4A1 [Ipomoea nil]|uniref:CASP-like protein 4A1 n=1 Tax=Ipomoea nil TaxID=35883 RepID=UPI000900F8F4|nr:PREDICTED: CASP-like protein 4A1 [Ipomoea nil]
MNVCSRRSQMEPDKPEPVSHPVPGKPESISPSLPGKPESVSHPVPKHTETGSHLELEESGEDTASDSSQSSPRENASNRKDAASGDAVADKPASPPGGSPPRSSISSGVSNLTHGSSPREEKASISPPAPVGKDPKPEVEVKKSVRNESLALVKVDHAATDVGRGRVGGGGGETRRRLRQRLSSLKISRRENTVKKAALGFRIFGFLFCLVSFSVMVADRKQGWAIDSFQRYKEFRYSLSVNAIGFMYSGAQAIDLIYHSATGNNFFRHPLRHYSDFAIDQAITYLLISASSSAATRVDDWRLNWGKDKFPDMASAAVTMSFLAFIAMAFSSLISGYALCTSKSIHS